jgi:hypothetical protein
VRFAIPPALPSSPDTRSITGATSPKLYAGGAGLVEDPALPRSNSTRRWRFRLLRILAVVLHVEFGYEAAVYAEDSLKGGGVVLGFSKSGQERLRTAATQFRLRYLFWSKSCANTNG